MRKPRLLDLFCGAGGAAMGYARAGFEVVGVDIAPQPHYPFEFYQGDAMTWPLEGYNAIHASPPCQHASSIGKQSAQRFGHEYPQLIPATRARLVSSGLLYVIENVVGAELVSPIRLCGSSFGLDVRRHRLFETGRWAPLLIPPCAHHWQRPAFRSLDQRRTGLASVVGVHGHVNYAGEADIRSEAMGVDWMTQEELTQAIPPAYTDWLGVQLLAALENERGAA